MNASGILSTSAFTTLSSWGGSMRAWSSIGVKRISRCDEASCLKSEPESRCSPFDPTILTVIVSPVPDERSVSISRWKVADVLTVYHLTDLEAQRLLIRLDRLKIIELQPFNNVRLLVSRHFKWRADGPVQRFFSGYADE